MKLLKNLYDLYVDTTDEIRRRLNQAIFGAIYIIDDEVAGSTLTAPHDEVLGAGAAYNAAQNQAFTNGTDTSEDERATIRIAEPFAALAPTSTDVRCLVRLKLWKQLSAAGTDDHGFRSSFPRGIEGFATLPIQEWG